MSAVQDKSQRITFLYANLAALYRKNKDVRSETVAPASPVPVTTAEPLAIIKGQVLHAVEAKPYQAPELLGKRLKPMSIRDVQSPMQSEAVISLKTNLEKLEKLQAKLRFLLTELEEHSGQKKS